MKPAPSHPAANMEARIWTKAIGLTLEFMFSTVKYIENQVLVTQSCLMLLQPHAPQVSLFMGFSRQEYWSG